MRTRGSKFANIFVLLGLFGVLALGSARADDRGIRVRGIPEYPAMGKQLHLSGTVRMKVKVAPDGSVKKVAVIGGSPVFVPAAVAAVEKWKFDPAPRETEETVAVTFNVP